MDDDKLRAELRSAIPEPPDTSAWADEARLRHGRRTRLAMTSAVAVLVLAVTGAFLWPSSNESGRVAVPATSPSAMETHAPPLPTSSSPTQCRGLAPSTSPAEVPARADRLLLCPTARSAASTFAPLDAVVGDGTAKVLNTLTGLPKASSRQACTEEFGPDYLLVAESDGRPPVVMVLQIYGCELVGLTEAPRVGADKVLTSFTKELSRQRELIDRPAATRTGRLCGTLETIPTSVMPMTVSEATAGRLCVYGAGSEPIRESTLTAADVRAIVADFPGRNGPFTPLPCPYRPNAKNLRIALTSFYGDVVVLAQSCGGVFVFIVGGQHLQWQPSEALDSRLSKVADR